MTYQDLINIVGDTVSSVCMNISNFGTVPAELKQGYVKNQTTGLATVTMTITNPVIQHSSSDVTNDFIAFCKSVNPSFDANATVTKRGIIKFYGMVSVFCSCRCLVAMGSASAKKAVVYSRVKSFGDFSKIKEIPEGDLIVSLDGNVFSTEIIKYITTNAKAYQVKYNTTFHR